jgi:predicted alpha-1,2-mannosidase
MNRVAIRNLLVLGFLGTLVASASAETLDLADQVDPMLGVAFGHGSCVPGVCLPHGSTYASPDTTKNSTAGYVPGEAIVGFSQLHTQGTGGTPSYGNLLVSPQIGLAIREVDHASRRSAEVARCYYYGVHLDRYGIKCEVVPGRHSALYRMTFPKSTDAHIVLDVARKLGAAAAMRDGSVTIERATGAIHGGGTFALNWNPAPYTLYFRAEISKRPAAIGVWKGSDVQAGVASADARPKQPLGVFARFGTEANEVVYLKIAVSFKSETQAARWLAEEIPAWDFDGMKARAKAAWDEALAVITLEGSTPAVNRKFYSSLFHALVQPRDRTGDHANWDSTEPFWDDQYTLWDSWKTLYPLLALIRPEDVRDNVRAFIDRHKHNGYVATAFIQGKEYKVGQGGDEVDNIIADAYAKHIAGIDWQAAYELLRYHAEEHRTRNYREHGFVAFKEKNDYCGRMKSGSSTISFAYNDWCVAQVAKGLGKEADYQRFLKRSANWKNVWDPAAEDSGYRGFVRARYADGRFADTPARKGYNTDFYEGTCWIYSYVIPHDVPGMIERMGGRDRFIQRLCFALENDLIDFTNEPSFMTIWLFDQVGRPDLASTWADKLRRLYDDQGYPGDEDGGAMSSLYVFLTAGIFPIAGQDTYYLHGPSLPKMVLHLSGGRTLTILGNHASAKNIFIQSAKLNGQPLTQPCLHHADLVRGGVLEFTMGPAPGDWGK